MPLSWNEIRNRALLFSKEWEGTSSEKSDSQTFWNEFFEVYGITRRRVASFEEHVKKLDNRDGYIDLFWKGVLLVEHKSLGENLDSASLQAFDYFDGLKERELPRYIIVSDFARFRLYDLDEDQHYEFNLEELHKFVNLFGFIAGYQTHVIEEQDPVNIKAAERMGLLHDQMNNVGYEGHPLEIYLVRLLFCMFAEDTGIFERQQFQDYVELRAAEDGSDLGNVMDSLFFILNTPQNERLTNLDEQLAEFPYINGKLFEERLSPASFDSGMRQSLLDCCSLDWGRISPAIFGSLFQSIMDAEARRNLGAHYTSEKNILKLITPLFMDKLWAELEHIKGLKRTQASRLEEFHQKLRGLTFLDPACGCGNFLVIAYRELRQLELEVLRIANKSGQMIMDVHDMILLDVDQFYGIEIEEFPAQIAQVAMWLMDHQMNLAVSEELGLYFARIPLQNSANITCDNALKIGWESIIAPENLSYIMGNPPFVGAKYMSDSQREDVGVVFSEIANAGLLDLVAAWYVKAAYYVRQNPDIECAFVSTNSISMGEQVGVLWGWLLSQGVSIHFSHRTFSWSNEARGNAGVHCVIIGFGLISIDTKRLFDYDDIQGDAHEIAANNINPYLVDAPDIVLVRKSNPICNVPGIGIGNKPIDGGNFLFTEEEKSAFLEIEPQAEKWFRRWLGGHEFINGYHRWCLWLGECPPNELRQMPEALKRIQAVRDFRLGSKSAPTRKLAERPTRFHVENIPNSTYIIIPKVSSERRQFIPMGFESPDTLSSDLVFIIANSGLFHLGVLSSTMHNAWMRAVCGRLESRYRYSKDIVYNNFPWPIHLTNKQASAIESAAQSMLTVRDAFPEATLADLYDPLTMPSDLLKAHRALDKAVDKAYGKANFKSESERVAFLFDLYQQYTSQEN